MLRMALHNLHQQAALIGLSKGAFTCNYMAINLPQL